MPPHLGGSCNPFEKDYSNWIIPQNRSNHQLVVVCGCLWKKSGRKSKYVKVKGGNPNHCEVCILYIYMYVTIKYIYNHKHVLYINIKYIQLINYI